MSKLLLNQLVLQSQTEQKARIIQFDPKTTILTGDNDTGKSSILKSIVRALGAETRLVDGWKNARITIFLSFTVGSTAYSILRQGSQFTVFDNKGEPLNQFNSVSKGLGPFLASLFNFGLRLTTRDGKSLIPPPAFLLLPYYFDQDRSWTEPWRSFENLQQFGNWKQDLIEYHTGIRPNSFYKVKGKLGELNKQKEHLIVEQNAMKEIRSELRDKLELTSFNIDLDSFREEITELLIECEKIQKTSETIRNRLVNLHNERISIEAHIEIVKSSLKEISADYDFLQKRDHINCPTCGTGYLNDFSVIFDIALDEDKCEDLLSKLKEDLLAVKKKIDLDSVLHAKHEEEASKIQTLLAKRRQEVQLKDLIENQSKIHVAAVLKEKVATITKALVDTQIELDSLRDEMKALTNKEVADSTKSAFRMLMREYLFDLHVHGIKEKAYAGLNVRIKEQGSDLPRALLAYGFSILQIMRSRTSSVYCPVIIDSPIQQEQDEENHEGILNFIKNNRPDDCQLIVGVVDTKGVDFEGRVITFDRKRSVLIPEQYKKSQEILDPFFQKALLFGENSSD